MWIFIGVASTARPRTLKLVAIQRLKARICSWVIVSALIAIVPGTRLRILHDVVQDRIDQYRPTDVFFHLTQGVSAWKAKL